MPVQLTALDGHDIQQELTRRRYGFHGNRNAAVHLTRADPKHRFSNTGQPKRILLQPISFAHYQEIITKSHSVQEAADQIEAIATGKQLTPNFGGGGGMDPGLVERIIENRMDNAIAAQTAPMAERMADQAATIEDQKALIAKLEAKIKEKPAAKTAGKKKAKKRTRRNVVEDAIAAVANDEPELTEAQQAMLAKVQMERPE